MLTGDQLSLLPSEPGVYVMKNAQGNIVYIGKANDIQKRVRSHFRRRDNNFVSPFIKWVDKVEPIITDNEVEALLLEYNLIKKHNPLFNVKLKDDKRYPYIKITTQEPYPRAYLTRTVDSDGARYFGPYPHVTQARRTLSALHEILPLRTCKYPSEILTTVRPCLEYEMGRCCAPCGFKVTQDEYQVLCQGILDFLSGHCERVLQTLQERMDVCAEAYLFEKAAFYRDVLEAARQFVHGQKMLQQTVENQDFLGYARVHTIACVVVIRRRGGRVVGTSRHFLENVAQADTPEILNAFIEQFYLRNTDIPKEIYSSAPVGAVRIRSLESWLAVIADRPVHIKIPQRGIKHAMLQLAEKNSRHTAEQEYRKLHGLRRGVSQAVMTLQAALQLETLPLRIEGYDVSNTQGEEAVGAMVVFQEGKPLKSAYRRFKIRQVDQIDDYSMMQEMLRRRFRHGEENQEEQNRFAQPPDLILIDGGKGHLHAAMKILAEFKINSCSLCSLAKQEEEIFLPDEELSLRLDRRNLGLRLLQQVRDEAHRFGLAYHRRLRGKSMQQSLLRTIPGIGPTRERLLLKKFGSLESLRSASKKEIASLPRITAQQVERIWDFLHAKAAEESGLEPTNNST